LFGRSGVVPQKSAVIVNPVGLVGSYLGCGFCEVAIGRLLKTLEIRLNILWSEH